VVREGQKIDLYWDLRTTSGNLADHHWSAEQTLGTTVLRVVSIFFSFSVRVHIENDAGSTMSEDERDETVGQVRQVWMKDTLPHPVLQI
jgi:hypothetical protein